MGIREKNSISSMQRIRDLRQQRERETGGGVAAATVSQGRFRLTSDEIQHYLNVCRPTRTKLINSRLTIAVNKFSDTLISDIFCLLNILY